MWGPWFGIEHQANSLLSKSQGQKSLTALSSWETNQQSGIYINAMVRNCPCALRSLLLPFHGCALSHGELHLPASLALLFPALRGQWGRLEDRKKGEARVSYPLTLCFLWHPQPQRYSSASLGWPRLLLGCLHHGSSTPGWPQLLVSTYHLFLLSPEALRW